MENAKPNADLQNILSNKLLPLKDKLQPLLDTNDSDKTNEIVDQSNVYAQSKPEDIKLSDDIEPLSKFLTLPSFKKFKDSATELLLSGHYVPQFIFAGSATRLNRGPMYELDIWELAVELGKAKPHEAKFHLGMGPRQIIAYRLALEALASQQGKSSKDVLSCQKMIVNINADIEKMVVDDFRKNKLYGFDPNNVYFIVQPTFHGFKLHNGSLEIDLKSPTMPYGHGHNFMQLGQMQQAFTLAADGNRRYVEGSVLDQFLPESLMGSHRINDMTRFSKDAVVSVAKLAYAIFKIEQGFDIIGELVDNPNKQKGGNVLKNSKTGKSFLIETSNVTGSRELNELLEEARVKGSPYNAFRLVYKVESLKKILKDPLPFNLRFKGGNFYLEAVTGDVTQMPQTKAQFMSCGENIHDFKALENIEDALAFLRQSDNQLGTS